MTTLIELERITKTYSSEKSTTQALGEISLRVATSEVVVLMGPSGAGKSTLLGIASLMIRPTSGKVTILGRDVAQLGESGRDRVRGESFGLIPQSPRLFADLTAVQNVEVASLNVSRANAREAVERVGLEHRVDHRAGLLSGGEQQRLSLARALVNRPSVIVADEPTSGLDDHNAVQLCTLLRELADDGAAVVIATHDARVLPYVTRQIDIISAGAR
ncbi:ABC transporter ATP-binding protein [Demequina oxidasica]|uniref:ABC transporter ATP-binding protein n=1 Tax=Demequina oxidasica TaxID=676199 RepID=UPI0009FE05FA|nr:ABC transporter ATP-binding protein [Demequina oxidasica]